MPDFWLPSTAVHHRHFATSQELGRSKPTTFNCSILLLTSTCFNWGWWGNGMGSSCECLVNPKILKLESVGEMLSFFRQLLKESLRVKGLLYSETMFFPSSVESWLVNRDPFFMAYEQSITGQSNFIPPPKKKLNDQGFGHCSNIFCKYGKRCNLLW